MMAVVGFLTRIAYFIGGVEQLLCIYYLTFISDPTKIRWADIKAKIRPGIEA